MFLTREVRIVLQNFSIIKNVTFENLTYKILKL